MNKLHEASAVGRTGGGIGLTAIHKSYGTVPVLRDVSLRVVGGEFVTLLGPSGCGKSTLLRIIAGLEGQDSGSVSIGGRVVDGLAPKRRDVAMVFQSYALYPHMTVAQNMALPLRMRRLSSLQRLPLLGRLLPGTDDVRAAISADVERTASVLELGALLGRKPGQLSGGQRQRVAVGRAMVRDPAVFLMDEPLSNLDAKLRVAMRAGIKDLHQRLGATFVYVTHDQAEAMTLSDRVAVMLDGELLQVAPPQTIYSDPASLRVAEFIGSPKINVLAGQVRDAGHVEVAGQTWPLVTGADQGTALQIGVWPEAWSLGAGSCSVQGTVRFIEHGGSELHANVQVTGLAEPLIVRMAAERAGDLHQGISIGLAAQADRILLFDAAGRRLRPSPSSVLPLRSYA
jgi:multiple sugar transport system ATP-binding protein